ncbi:MAG: PVC-type heme-binding CxxCH protein [Planctomycetota bacterium]
MMPRASCLGLVLVLTSITHGLAAELQLNGHTFTLPDGFEIEVAAKSPLVDRPITADFDELGRLYVTDSSGSNEPVVKQLANPTHRIVRLEDTDGDGRFDKSVVFADKMMFPEGTLWHDGSLYVAAPPSIWKLTDTDGNGVADQRVEWLEGKTLTGCANDLHGPYLGPDGFIYWCKGAFAEQTYEQPGKKPLVTKASHIFRRRADGTGPIENVMTGGMDNPVDVAFTPGGERIFTTTFLQTPGGGLRDGLIHAVYGGVYGKVHNVTDFHPRTGDLLPPLAHMGAAAPCGLTRYESNVFGTKFRDNLFACQFNMYKVSRHELKNSGATFSSKDSDFVVSNNLDFHPTDVLEDADGSLVICDTGGWYKLCCPTSQLDKPDVLGAVYRVRRTGAAKVEDPRGLKLDWAKLTPNELARLLDDPRPAVQRRAIRDLAKHDGAKVAAALKPLLRALEAGGELSDDKAVNPNEPFHRRSASETARMNAVWTLTRIDAPEARQLVRGALLDSHHDVRQVALQSVSLWRDHAALPQVVKLLRVCTIQNTRLCAEILGRLGDKSVVPQLLEAAPANISSDRFREHALTFALIEIADPQGTAVGLKSDKRHERQIAMIALDQMPGGGLTPDQVVPLLTERDPVLRETALWLVARHGEWGDALANHLREELKRDRLREHEQRDLTRLLAQFAGTPNVQQLMAGHVKAGAASDSESTVRLMVLHAMQSSGLKQMPESWLASLTNMLAGQDETLKPSAVAVVRALPLPKTGTEELAKALRLVALHNGTLPEARIEAVAALPAGAGNLEPELFSLLIGGLSEETSVSARSAAVEALLKTKLTVEQQTALADAIPRVGPLELNRLLGAFETSTEEQVGMKLVAGLKQSPVLTSLRVDSVTLRLAKFPASVQQQAEAIYATINVEAARQKERLDEVVGLVGQGDIRRGQLVFANSKAACVACHAIGYKGGNIGPDLSRIGKIRTERDLLESLLFPSVSFVRSYEPVLIVTHAGKQVSGLIRRETPDEIVLATGAKEEARVLRADIEEIRPGTVSIMPAGLETQLTREQLLDLIAFLKSRQ